jgi:crotonobetainyl-CoA:carnitine CoA-transferase CaiB-like acyl-CoA transferase
VTGASGRRPLQGIRVLDFGRFIAAPYCAMVLADLGAEVLRVERPGGDDDRRLGLEAANGETFTFTALARGKRGITLDPRRGDAAHEVLRDLVRWADVLIHNFGPEAATALRLTYEDVREHRPDIVYAAISCFGPGGGTGFDPMAQMASGAAMLSGFEADPPLRSGLPWADYGTGLAAAVGVLAALRHRDATGEGQSVDCALLQTAVSFMAPAIAEAVVAGTPRPRLGNQAAYLAPSNLYRCRDGLVYLAAVTSGTWRALAEVIGRPELGAAPDLRTAGQRFEQRDLLDAAITAWSERRTVREAVDELAVARVPAGAHLTPAEVAEDDRVRAGGMLDRVDLEVPGLERVPVSVTPLRLSRSAGRPPSRPPHPGEHNDETYRDELGYDEAHLAQLRSAGVI